MCKSKYVKWLMIVLTLVLAVTVILPGNALAEETGESGFGSVEVHRFAAPAGTAQLEAAVNIKQFETYLIEQTSACKKEINIESYRIPYSDKMVKQLYYFVFNTIPELFHCDSMAYYYNNGILTSLVMYYDTYADTSAEYAACFKSFTEAAEILLHGIESNTTLTDVEKALLIHDRLAMWTEYDYANYLKGQLPDISYTAYGVFAKQVAVCQGYAMAYSYLLDIVGVKNSYTSSELIDHAWNIVYIDGLPYHVDVTWDDPIWDMTGRVNHVNFLRSTAGIAETGHAQNGVDYVTTPTSTKYDNAYWQNSNAAFQLIGNDIYYIDHTSKQLKRDDGKVLCSVDGQWKSASGGIWSTNYARLDSDGARLLYSLPDAVYAYDLSTGSSQKVYAPNLSIGTNYSIFGFKYEKGYFICDRGNTPNYVEGTKNAGLIREFADIQKPSATFRTTIGADTKQILYADIYDNVGLYGYYFGTNSDYTKNSFYKTSDKTVSQTISGSGTYYYAFQDSHGNVSQPYGFTYYKITLNGNGGTVTPTYIIMNQGMTFTFPKATKTGYQFIGWSTNAGATTGITTLKASGNATYYAIFQGDGPKITKQPVSVSVASGKNATVSFTASGEGLTYKWYYKNKNASAFSLTTAYTGNTYTIQMNADRNGRQLYCVVTDKSGKTATTDVVTISMTSGLTITKQPVSTKAANNKSLTVSFAAAGEGLTYKWYYKDKGASVFTYTSSFKTNAYTTVMTAARNGRQIYCVVTDKYGQTVKTNTATISMAAAPKITKQPVSTKAVNNKSLTVSFTASGEGLSYKWYYKDKGASVFTYTSSFKTQDYTVVMTAARDGRQLYCVVTDKYGQTAKTNTVTISRIPLPNVTKAPVSASAINGKTVTVSFTAVGEGLTYKWYYANKGVEYYTYTSSFKSSTYTTTMNASRDGRRIFCEITDKYGQTVWTDIVTISMIAAPKITKQPVSAKAANGKSLTVSLKATGTGLSYKWYYKNKGASAFTYTSSFKSNTYTTTMDATRNGRQLYCVVTDKYGQSVKTSTVTISMAAAPKITQQPVSVKALSGEDAGVSVVASGEGLTYKWYYANKGSSNFLYTSSFTSNHYTVVMNADRDGRRVYCVVTDKYGQSVKSNIVTLTMMRTVNISSQSDSIVKANMGGTITAKVVATGDGLTYKWYYKDKGATDFTYTSSFKGNTYTTTMTAARDGRSVYCVVTDKYGNEAVSNTTTFFSNKAKIKGTITVSEWMENGKNVAKVQVKNVSGGSGNYAYMYQVYTSENSSTPALTYELSGDTYIEFESWYSLDDCVTAVYIADDEGNVAAYLVDMNSKVLNYLTVS